MAKGLISKKNNQRDLWDKIWSNKNVINKIVDVGRFFYNIRFLFILKKYVRVNTFCELGCGSSTLLVKIARSSRRVIGIDYSENSLHLSKELFQKLNMTNGQFIKDDCRNLKIKQKFDTVWSQGLIEHFKDPAKIIQQHLKVTRNNGYSIISVPYKYSYLNLWYLITKPTFLNCFWPWTPQLFFSRRMLESSLMKYCPEQTYYKIKVYPVMGIIILFVHKK